MTSKSTKNSGKNQTPDNLPGTPVIAAQSESTRNNSSQLNTTSAVTDSLPGTPANTVQSEARQFNTASAFSSSFKMAETGEVNKSVEETSAAVDNFMRSMGNPHSVRPDKHARACANIESFVGAKTKADIATLWDAITYLCIVHGTSPRVAWHSIDLVPGGSMKTVNMGAIVGNLVTLKDWRKFMSNYGSRAVEMVNSSPPLQRLLVERAARSSVSMTEVSSVIDFAPISGDMGDVMLRLRAKQSAVRRQKHGDLDDQARKELQDTAAAANNSGQIGAGGGSFSNGGDEYGEV